VLLEVEIVVIVVMVTVLLGVAELVSLDMELELMEEVVVTMEVNVVVKEDINSVDEKVEVETNCVDDSVVARDIVLLIEGVVTGEEEGKSEENTAAVEMVVASTSIVEDRVSVMLLVTVTLTIGMAEEIVEETNAVGVNVKVVVFVAKADTVVSAAEVVLL